MILAFHIHTCFSADGHIVLDDLYRRARAHQIAGLVVTDHNTMEGALRFRDRFTDLTTVVGEEVLTRDGEIIGLFLREPVAPGMSVAETLLAIRRQQGLVALPHPFDRTRPSTLRADVRDDLLRRKAVDFIEVFNGRTWGRAADRRAAAVARETGLAPLWGSDAHYPDEIGLCRVEMPPFRDAATFLAAAHAARPVRLRRTSLARRTLIRAKKAWGLYGALRLPEQVMMAVERSLFLAAGGGFVRLEEIDAMCDRIAAQVQESHFVPDVVVGILGGGAWPALQLARRLSAPCAMLKISYPQLRLGRLDTDDLIGSRFLRNRILGNEPRLQFGIRENLAGKRILLVDDDCTTGRSLRLAADSLGLEGAEIRMATLRVLEEPRFRPEYAAEIRAASFFRHRRFPWIRYSPYYRAYWQLKTRWIDPLTPVTPA